jgi:hypothetical protein
MRATVHLSSRRAERLALLVLAALLLGGTLWPGPGVASRQRAAQSILATGEALVGGP